MWQQNALGVVYAHREETWSHVLQSAIGDGKTVIAYGEIIARCCRRHLSTHKALYAVPYRRLAREKGEELRAVFERLRGARPNEIRVVEGKRSVRDITLTRVVIGTFEHFLQYLACAKAMVKTWSGRLMLGGAYKIIIIDEAHMMFDGSRGDLVNEIVCLCRCLHISVLMLTGTLQRGE
jgi:replicative superfamily II helicase